VQFSVSTAATDPQTGTPVRAPEISANGAQLDGDLRAFGASWNRGHFNQGSPKPDGSKPGLTSGPTGTYDAATGTFTLEWSSAIVGGPFNGFTGEWHFAGRFVAATPSDTTPTTAAPAMGVGVQASTPTDATPPASLADTGGDSGGLIVLGALLLAIGTLLALSSPRVVGRSRPRR
jgi:hypothetical protein